MTFAAIENSNELGLPVRLYAFHCGEGRWNYASSQTGVTLGGTRYDPVALSDTGMSQSGDLTSDAFSIDMPADLAPARCFVGTPPSGPMFVHVRDYHPGEPDAPVLQVFVVDQVDWPTPGLARATCSTLDASMEREGLRLGYQRTCPYAVYDQGTCKVNREDFSQTGIIRSSGNGILIIDELASHAVGRFNGGYIEWMHPLLGAQQRGIEEHAGNQIRLLGASDGLLVGMPVVCYYGCSQTPDVCKGVFDNYDNYGGFPSMPGESPFNRSSTMF